MYYQAYILINLIKNGLTLLRIMYVYYIFTVFYISSKKIIPCPCHVFDIVLSDTIVNDYKGNLNDYRRNMIKTQVELNQPCVKRYFLPKNDSGKFQETITKKRIILFYDCMAYAVVINVTYEYVYIDKNFLMCVWS